MDYAERAAALRGDSAEADRLTVPDAVDPFLTGQMVGKKSATAIQHRMDRLARLLRTKMRDVVGSEVIVAKKKIAGGRTKGRAAKQLAEEPLIQAKRPLRFAETRALEDPSDQI